MTANGVRSSWLTSARSSSTLALVDLEPGDHRVEAGDELADRAKAPFRRPDPDGVVAGLYPPGRLDESIERPTRAAEALVPAR